MGMMMGFTGDGQDDWGTSGGEGGSDGHDDGGAGGSDGHEVVMGTPHKAAECEQEGELVDE